MRDIVGQPAIGPICRKDENKEKRCREWPIFFKKNLQLYLCTCVTVGQPKIFMCTEDTVGQPANALCSELVFCFCLQNPILKIFYKRYFLLFTASSPVYFRVKWVVVPFCAIKKFPFFVFFVSSKKKKKSGSLSERKKWFQFFRCLIFYGFIVLRVFTGHSTKPNAQRLASYLDWLTTSRS